MDFLIIGSGIKIYYIVMGVGWANKSPRLFLKCAPGVPIHIFCNFNENLVMYGQQEGTGPP